MEPDDPLDTSVLTQRPPERALMRAYVLEVVDGPDAGARYTAAAERSSIGTHERADFLLSDRAVSRLHCEIVLVDGRTRIRDLGSRNGTRVDGVAVVDAFIEDGQVFSIGNTRIQLRLADEPVEIPLATGGRFGGLVGSSQPMRAVYAVLEKAAATDATVLLGGETGTGKEAAAEAIHEASARRGGPLVVVDCGAIPPDLLQSELFGHERGAFTGAHAQRPGAFEVADGGTILLDEIGELAPDLQPQLLRVLERRQIKRVGASTYIPVDVRVISATHRDLAVEVNAQRFRSDLYFRLAVIEVRLPPLRERKEDLPELVDYLLERLATSPAVAASLRSSASLETLGRHAWPGNVRELRNYLERSIALQGGAPAHAAVGPATVPAPPGGGDPDLAGRISTLEQALAEVRSGMLARVQPASARSVRDLDRDGMMRLLGQHGGHIGRAAAALGVHRRTLERRIKALGLR